MQQGVVGHQLFYFIQQKDSKDKPSYARNKFILGVNCDALLLFLNLFFPGNDVPSMI
jgi:hypothetical protein